MACLLRTGKGGVPVDEEGYFKRAVAFIRHNYSYPIQVSEIADYVGIDRTVSFMHQAGVSPKQYLSRYRLEEAKEMLVQTEYRITEIAYSLRVPRFVLLLQTFFKRKRNRAGQVPTPERL